MLKDNHSSIVNGVLRSELLATWDLVATAPDELAGKLCALGARLAGSHLLDKKKPSGVHATKFEPKNHVHIEPTTGPAFMISEANSHTLDFVLNGTESNQQRSHSPTTRDARPAATIKGLSRGCVYDDPAR